jgi:hypothetical protein
VFRGEEEVSFKGGDRIADGVEDVRWRWLEEGWEIGFLELLLRLLHLYVIAMS